MNFNLNLACADPDAQASFYCVAFGYERDPATGYYHSSTPGDGRPVLEFHRTNEPKRGPNRLHLDVIVGAEMEAEAARIEALGATRGERFSSRGNDWIVMYDPEGNEFCLCDG